MALPWANVDFRSAAVGCWVRPLLLRVLPTRNAGDIPVNATPVPGSFSFFWLATLRSFAEKQPLTFSSERDGERGVGKG